MSRGEEHKVERQAQAQNLQQAGNAQDSYTAAQGDVGDYKTELAKFASDNPYTAGGEFQTSQNKVLANTSDAAAQAAAQQMQAAAVRGGQNAGSAIAATEAIQQSNTRNLSAEEANQTAARIGGEATYNKNVLGATGLPASLESGMTGTESKGAEGALGVQQDAAKQPGFWDTLGDSFAQSFGKSVGSGAWKMIAGDGDGEAGSSADGAAG